MGTLKGWMFRKRCWVKPECINGIRNQGLKEQLRLRKERTSGMIFWENHQAGDFEVNSQVFYQDSKNKCQNIVKELAPSETKKKLYTE
jgi:hypothetical protein